MKLLLIVSAIFCTAAIAETGAKIVQAARSQIGVTTSYDPAYVAMKYPGGDVPQQSGVCSDVIIRALRSALSAELQKLVHKDMKEHFLKYPKIWGLRKTDRSIDHRRVPNLMTFFKRKHSSFSHPNAQDAANFLPGDIVTCTVPPNLPHIMILSDRKNRNGLPLVIHNIGSGVNEEDHLSEFPLTGHFRWAPKS